MLKEISNYLTALQSYLKQVHLLAHNKDYEGHLLAERLYEPIGNDIDRIKELSLGLGEDRDIAYAYESLSSARDILNEYPMGDDLTEMWRAAKRLEIATISIIDQTAKQYAQQENLFGVQGILNALGDISEKRIRDIYLINTQVD